MTVPANTLVPVRSDGDPLDNPAIEEYIQSSIVLVSRSKTPFLSMIPWKTARQPVLEWLLDDWNNHPTDPIEYGSNLEPAARNQVSRRKIVLQTIATATSISEEELATHHIGYANRASREWMKMGVEQRIRMAKDIVLPRGSTLPVNSNSAKALAAGLSAFIGKNHYGGATSTAGGFSTTTQLPTARTAGTKRDFTEDQVRTASRGLWKDTNGVMSNELWSGGVQKENFSTFSGIAPLRRQANGMSQAQIQAAADTYISDFATFTFHADPYFEDDAVYLLDRKNIEICGLFFNKRVPLAKLGLSDRFGVATNFGLKVRAEGAMAGIFDLNE